MRGHLFEARRRLDAMAAVPWSRHSPVLRAWLMEALGGVCWWQADMPAMRVAYDELVALWRADGNRSELANALYNYSFCFSISPNPREAPGSNDPDGVGWASLQEALDLYRVLDDERGQANVLWGIGNKEYFTKDPSAGVAAMTEALEIYRRVGERTMEAWALHMLGAAKLRLGDSEASRGLFAAAPRMFQGSGDASGLTLVFDDLASQAAYDGDPERAARLWGAARAVSPHRPAPVSPPTSTSSSSSSCGRRRRRCSARRTSRASRRKERRCRSTRSSPTRSRVARRPPAPEVSGRQRPPVPSDAARTR
jgi:hypothetical protein